MKILFINQPYWPDYVATAQILTDLSEELVKKGHQVSVVCSRKPYLGGTKYPAYERHNGVEIIRVATFGFGKKHGIVGRILDFSYFYLAATFKCLRLKEVDVVVSLSSPPMIGLIGRMLQILKGTPHINWCMDVFPDGFVVNGVIKRTGFVNSVLSVITTAIFPWMDLRLLSSELKTCCREKGCFASPDLKNCSYTYILKVG